MAEHWDAIVLGLGGVGSAAIRHLAARGARVLGLEQYSAAHDHGSSHGKTRIIRQAYFEHPSYVPLLRRAYELWDLLELDAGKPLFERCGLVEMGPADGIVISGVLESANRFQLPIECLTPKAITERWSGIAGQADWQAVIETNAGFLRVEDCVRSHLELAQRDGADCRFGVKVLDWHTDERSVSVTTDLGQHHALRLFIAAGSWSGQLFRKLGVPLRVLRKHLYWFETDEPGFALEDGFPCFFHETETGFYYGFPALDSLGVKVARHSGGQWIDGPDDSPSEVDVDVDDLRLVKDYVASYLPGVSSRLSKHAACYYTNTLDEHFIIDHHPDSDRVAMIAGLSGHGFKFASVLGEIACQMLLGESPQLDLSLFRLQRFRQQSDSA